MLKILALIIPAGVGGWMIGGMFDNVITGLAVAIIWGFTWGLIHGKVCEFLR